MGTIFVAGIYGVGKSTLCHKLSKALCFPDYSASDLISAINGEKYGVNKCVHDKNANQDILAIQVKHLLEQIPTIFLTGHFCIFDAAGHVDELPDSIFSSLSINAILLLEASPKQIIENLSKRDRKRYSLSQIIQLQEAEIKKAKEIAKQLHCPICIHQMRFDDTDLSLCLAYLKGEIRQ